MEKQAWVEKCLGLEERLKQLEETCREFDPKLVSRLMSELNVCFNQLRSLMNISASLIEGEEPDVSALLGLRGE